MKQHLKIKIKSLAEEGRIIHHEERKALKSSRWLRAQLDLFPPATRLKDPASIELFAEWDQAGKLYESMHNHRTHNVRKEARYSLVAYGFLRGRDYDRVEKPTKNPLTATMWNKIEDLVVRFSGEDERIVKQRFQGWKPSSS